MADKKPLLDLKTLTDREFITIDGEAYELRNADEFSIVELQRLSTLGKKLQRLFEVEELSEEQEAELRRVPDKICRQVLIAPDEVQDGLNDTQRAAIAQAFTQLQVRTVLQRAGAMKEALETGGQTGEHSERA